MYFSFLVIILIIYIITIFAILYFLSIKSNLKNGPYTELFISIIVPASNEEKNIQGLLDSILKQDYASDKFEIVIIDDRSIDKTGDIALSYKSKFENFKIIRINDKNTSVTGKQNALDVGVKNASSKYIVQTDCDCILDKKFLKTYSNYFSFGFDLIFGKTSIYPVNSIFDKLQAFDLDFLFTVAASTSKASLPLSAMGNNMGFLKDKYINIGGFENLGKCDVEDYQLLTAFKKAGMKIKFIDTEYDLVYTKPLRSILQFVFQRLRWAQGAFSLNIPVNFLTLVVLLINTLCMVTVLFFCQIWFIGFKILIDFFMFYKINSFFGKTQQKKIFIFFVWEIYFLIYPIMVLILKFWPKKDNWG